MFLLQKKVNDSEYGSDLPAVEKEYENHQKEHKIIHQFHTNVDQCAAAEVMIFGKSLYGIIMPTH